jgi:hypothetical protein
MDMMERTMQTTALLFILALTPSPGTTSLYLGSIRFIKYYHTNGKAVTRNSSDTLPIMPATSQILIISNEVTYA